MKLLTLKGTIARPTRFGCALHDFDLSFPASFIKIKIMMMMMMMMMTMMTMMIMKIMIMIMIITIIHS